MLVEDEAVRIVVADQDAMSATEIHDALIQRWCGVAAGRHVGIVGPHHLHAAQIHLLQGIEVGLPTFVLQQIVVDQLGTYQLADRAIGRIARIGNQDPIAWIQEGE